MCVTIDTADDVQRPIKVTLQYSGVTLDVAAGQSILDAVLTVLPHHPYSCREGYCGSCETAVLGGTPEHHDSVLTEEERQRGETMMICVGRATTAQLVLAL
jgi:ferredoxin